TDRLDAPDKTATGELASTALGRAADEIDGLTGDPDQAFVTAVLEGATAHPSFSVALRAHRLADAAYRSADAGGATLTVE
ncbi:MAG: hypothetical protein AAFO29_25305, partial [Actinomycetota bacterium]